MLNSWKNNFGITDAAKEKFNPSISYLNSTNSLLIMYYATFRFNPFI